jgi:hypothetical protein
MIVRHSNEILPANCSDDGMDDDAAGEQLWILPLDPHQMRTVFVMAYFNGVLRKSVD